jgi:hypothetical protein
MVKSKQISKKKKESKKRSPRKEKDLSEMTPKEKKDFLQHDLIERMIRIEQAVSANMGKPLKHNETDFYKELTKEEKMGFNRHINSKKRKGVLKMVALILPLAAFGFMRMSITGNAIRDSTGAEPYWWGWVALGIFIVLGVFFWASHILKKTMERRLKRHEKELIGKFKKK